MLSLDNLTEQRPHQISLQYVYILCYFQFSKLRIVKIQIFNNAKTT